MEILVTNDDGINSPGLKAAVEAVLSLGNVIVVAPSHQQTSASRSFSGDKNAVLEPVQFEAGGVQVTAYHCNCAPARAVLHAFDILFTSTKPGLLVSGINYGENLGNNSTISGTLGAAIQAATLGVKGVAVSLQTKIEDHFSHTELNWSAASHFCRKFAELIIKNQLPDDVDVINVNVPASADESTRWRVTRLSRQGYFGNVIHNPAMSSRISDAKCCYAYDLSTIEPDSDIMAVCSGLVSVSPVSTDLTSRVDLNSLFSQHNQ